MIMKTIFFVANVFFGWPSIVGFVRHEILKNITFDTKILGGRDAIIEEFPFMVRLIVDYQTTERLCGGSYIGAVWVLTSAHCLDINPLHVVAAPNPGKHDRIKLEMGLDTLTVLDTKQERISVRLIIHPEFYRNKVANLVQRDIGLIQIGRGFEITSKVKIAILPQQLFNYNNEPAVIIGWGQNSENNTGKMSDTLKATDVIIFSRETCRPFNLMNQAAICVGEKGKIACFGDSGSPLWYRGMVVGVFSFSVLDRNPSYNCSSSYAVYERVFKYIPWIRENVPDLVTSKSRYRQLNKSVIQLCCTIGIPNLMWNMLHKYF